MPDRQPTILAPLPPVGRSLTLRLKPDADPAAALRRLAAGFDPAFGAIGLGAPLVARLGRSVPGLRSFPAIDAAVAVPATQDDVWIALRGADRTEVFDRGEALAAVVADDFDVVDAVDTFLYAGGRDLTGYEDGTANPDAEESVAVAICDATSPIAGSSFVSVQRWVHDLAAFRAHDEAGRDAIVGRRHADNEEIEDAPESAHVKRTAQELFAPTAFMVRRSLPFADPDRRGLEFVAYCATLDAFERMLRHMAGLDDDIVDALFGFSKPVTGGHYWCPPVAGGRLDLAAIGL